MMDFLYIKALHIIFVITWFAGLFYIVRLFIYHTEANQLEPISKKILQNQYKIMEYRLWYIITWPSAVLASIFGFQMVWINPIYLEQPWMLVKLSFVFLLYLYHLRCHNIFSQLKKITQKIAPFILEFEMRSQRLFYFQLSFLSP